MLILYRLISFYDALPLDDTYRASAAAILKHLHQIPSLSIEALAELCWSSPTTRNRLVRKLGCSSFSGFKREIQDALESYSLQAYKMVGSPLLLNPDPADYFRSTAFSAFFLCTIVIITGFCNRGTIDKAPTCQIASGRHFIKAETLLP